MKIIITVTSDIIFDQRVQKIARSLVGFGNELIIICRKKKEVETIRLPFEIKYINCIFSRTLFFYLEYNCRLFFKLIFSKFDLVCACDLDTILGAGLAAKWNKKKLFFDAHEFFEQSVEILDHKWKQQIWEQIARFCLPWTSDRYTVSNSLADIMEKKYGLHFKVIRNVPPKVKLPVVRNPEKVIWYQGAVNKGRGLELIIACLEDLQDYSFHIAGDGDILKILKSLVKEKHLESRVKFYGRLSYSQMLAFSSVARIGVDLLESSSLSYYYSLSNKTFDYMMFGLPSIQMNFPEYAILNKSSPTGVLINRLDKLSFISAVRQLEDRVFYQKCIEACKLQAEIYNWDAEEKNLAEIYKF